MSDDHHERIADRDADRVFDLKPRYWKDTACTSPADKTGDRVAAITYDNAPLLTQPDGSKRPVVEYVSSQMPAQDIDFGENHER